MNDMIPTIITADRTGRNMTDLFSADFLANRRIFLSEEITSANAAEIILQLEYLDSRSNADILFYINCPGGSVTAGLSILDAMNRCKSPIVTVCTGIGASMAAILVCCGQKGKRFITPMAEMMIHQPLAGISGQASDVERTANHVIKIKEKLNRILSEHTGKDIQTISADSDRDYYLNAKEAIEYGLVDHFWREGSFSSL